MQKYLQLYIHIPFCIKKCRYCTVPVKTGNSETKSRYLNALERELEAALPTLQEYTITSIYMGGGSPSALNPDAIAKLMRKLKNRLNLATPAEVCIEAMPQTIGTSSLSGLGVGGFTRMSLSMQSGNDDELAALDCGFSVQDIQNSVIFLDRFGMRNVNIDLMYGNPLQTISSWKETLRRVRDFDPEHVSIYPFTAQAHGCPTIGEQREMLLHTRKYLLAYGYTPYSLYHFAKRDHISRYFHDRFSGCEYMGFGLGSKSFIDDVMYENTNDYSLYLEHSADFETITTNITRLDESQLKQRYIVENLHLAQGVLFDEYSNHFGSTPLNDFATTIETLSHKNWIEVGDRSMVLTPEGALEAPNVWSEVLD